VTATTSSQFVPSQVTIADEGQVTWTFQSVTHNVKFGGTAGAPADIGNSTSVSVSRTFSTPGEYDYLCDLHPGMNGTVVVVAP
jgi:plastocyanin